MGVHPNILFLAVVAAGMLFLKKHLHNNFKGINIMRTHRIYLKSAYSITFLPFQIGICRGGEKKFSMILFKGGPPVPQKSKNKARSRKEKITAQYTCQHKSSTSSNSASICIAPIQAHVRAS